MRSGVAAMLKRAGPGQPWVDPGHYEAMMPLSKKERKQTAVWIRCDACDRTVVTKRRPTRCALCGGPVHRVRKTGNGTAGHGTGKPSPARRALVFARDGHQCLRCGDDEHLTLDHIVPRSKGGGNEMDNLQTLCKSCNELKGNASEWDYRDDDRRQDR